MAYSREGNGTPFQYSCLENPMDGGAWEAAVHGVAKSQIWQRDFTFTFHFHALEKEMATYSSVLAWRIPGMGEPGGPPCMGSHRVRHDWSDLAAADSIFKSRDITLPTKVCLVKAMVFPVVMYGCESWTVKQAERQRIDAFELWCWRRLLRVPWTARRSNQSILKISPGISLEGMMLELKLQYFGHLMQRVDSLEKTLMLEGLGAGGEGDDRGWDGWMASLTQWACVWVSSGNRWWKGRLGVLWFMGSQRVRHNWATELNWAELNN